MAAGVCDGTVQLEHSLLAHGARLCLHGDRLSLPTVGHDEIQRTSRRDQETLTCYILSLTSVTVNSRFHWHIN